MVSAHQTESKIKFSPLWTIFWCRWYKLIDNFFWYVYAPLVGILLIVPIIFEEAIYLGLINAFRRWRNPEAEEWSSQFFYWVSSMLMFQCPNCRTSCLQDLWKRRWNRHNTVL
jgi:hypothetical protein